MKSFPWWTDEQTKFEQEMNNLAEDDARDGRPVGQGSFHGHLRKDRDRGYAGAGIPKDYGGMGLGATGACIAAEALNECPESDEPLWATCWEAKADR
jgi:alkylation response protein AidB-like acyl-CoA dehydrogenase